MLEEARRREEQARFDAAHPREARNMNGQFATPYELAVEIVEDALSRIDNPSPSMLEPSCGTGAFISAAKALCPSITVVGVEIDRELFEIARNLWADSTTEIFNQDFFEVARTLPRFDAVVTNPPYSRHHHLNSQRKSKCASVVKDLTGRHPSGLAGLHTYFVLAGTQLVKTGGIASWLIPAELFSVNYGSVIRSFVTSEVTVERIHLFDGADCQFDDALVSSAVLVIRKKPATSDNIVEVTRGSLTSPTDRIELTIAELQSTQKWQHLFRSARNSPLTRIGDFFHVKRGLSTGAEAFYTKNLPDWETVGISKEWLIPVLPAPRHMHDMVVEATDDGWPTDYSRALLNISSSLGEDELPQEIRDYLATCPVKVRTNYTARHRKRWYAVEKREPAPIVCTYMSRSNTQPFRFIRNRSNAVVNNTYLCLYPNRDLSEDELDNLCESLNSIPPETLIAAGREYGGGLRKLEPSELLSVPFAV